MPLLPFEETHRYARAFRSGRTSRRPFGEIRAHHYHRSSRPISLADAVLIATAGDGDRIATADPDVLAVAGAEGIESLSLPGQG